MRTTGIRLIADVDQFKRQFRSGAQAVRDLNDKVTGVGGKFKELARNARHANQDIERGQRAMRANIETVDHQIRQVRDNLGRLSAEYVRGNTLVVKNISENQKRLKELTNIRKLLPGVQEMEQAGKAAGRGFHIGFMTISRPVATALGSVLIGATAAAMPFIGATIVGGIIGAAGFGGIIGGIVAASTDSRVQKAGEMLGLVIFEDLQTRAQRHFVEPLLQAMNQVRVRFQGLGGDLDRLFANSARFLRPLTEAVSNFIQRVTKAFADLSDMADPVMEAFANGINYTGEILHDFFAMFEDDGISAAVAVDTFFKVLGTTIRLVGVALNVLVETFGFLAKLGAFGRTAQREYLRMEANAKIAAEGNKNLAASFVPVDRAGTATADALAGLTNEVIKSGGPKLAAIAQSHAHARAMRGEEGAMKDLNNAIRSQIDPLFAFTQAQKKVKEAQDAATEAVKKHGANSSQAKNATRTLADAALDLQAKAGNLSSSFNGRLTPAMRDTFKAAGLTKGQIKQVENQLIDARKAADKYEGKYDAKVSVSGYDGPNGAKAKLTRLGVYQQALKKGDILPGFQGPVRGPDGKYYATGGWTGPGHTHEPAGVVHADEFVIRKSSRRKIEQKHPGLLAEMNATGQVPPGYARGGAVTWPFPATARRSWIPSREYVANRVIPNFGPWPPSPAAQRGDSGIWKRIVQLINASGITEGSFGNAYRHRDPKWHGSGRAVDWMGFNLDRLARFFAARRPLELIHRTNSRDYAYTRGRNVGSFNNALMEAHRNHLHIAMAGGGIIREPVLGVGASGATYSFAENGPERVLSTGQTLAGAGGTSVVNHVQVTVQAPVGSHPREIGRQVAAALKPYFEGGGRLIVHGRPVLP